MGSIRTAGVASLFLITCLASGCGDEDAPDPGPGPYAPFTWCTVADFERPAVERITIDAVALPAGARPGLSTVLDGTVDENPTACECVDESCVLEWIEDNMGCGVCVHLSCGAAPRAGCVPCPVPTDPLASRDDGDVTSCVLAPVDINAPGWDVQVEPSTASRPGPSRAPALDRDISRQPR